MKIFLVRNQFLIKTNIFSFPVKTERKSSDEIKQYTKCSNLYGNSGKSREE